MRRLLSLLWRLFSVIGVVLSFRRWWRTVTDPEERREVRAGAAAVLAVMVGLLVWSLVSEMGAPYHAASPVAEAPTCEQLVVDLRDDLSLDQIDAWDDTLGIELVPNSPVSVGERLMVADVRALDAAARRRLLERLRRDPRVEAADENFIVPLLGLPAPAFTPNDPRYPEQWNFRMIGMPQAWERSRGKGVVVAVIDTGVAFQTENGIPVASDLKQTAWTKPYDFITNRAKAYDDHGHGTHVAGTIAQSTNNGHGVAGIAFEATIMPLKVLTAQGYGTVSDIADAVHFAADNGAQVINMSLGGPRSSPVLRKACTYAYQRGVTIVCAAGNSGHEGVSYPAAYPECMAVSAVGPSGKLTFYSSWGKEIDIAAPGGEYQSPDRKADGILQNTVFGKQDVFEAWQGTSMASPHVAGVAALVIGQGVKGPEAVRKRLRDTARPKDDPNRYGAGLLDAAAAVAGGSEAVLVANTQRSIPWPVLALGLLLATWLLPGGGANTTVVRFSAAAPVAIGLSLPPAGLAANLACCAVWPLLLLLVGWGVRPARPALTGVLAGFAVGCALRLTSGAVLWPALNAAVAYGLARLAARPD